MPQPRRFPPPWTIEDHTETFIVRDGQWGQFQIVAKMIKGKAPRPPPIFHSSISKTASLAAWEKSLGAFKFGSHYRPPVCISRFEALKSHLAITKGLILSRIFTR